MSRSSTSDGRCLHALFEERARLWPNRVAVTAGDQRLTYAELNARADAIARRLRDLGVRSETLVGLLMERGVDLVAGILGILKAGGAYVPVDPAYPAQRVRFMLEDSGLGIVVTSRTAATTLDEVDLGDRSVERVLVDDITADTADGTVDGEAGAGAAAWAEQSDEDLAYVIYTSGSTGTPKGVQVTHRNAVMLFQQSRDLFAIDENDVWTMFHSVCFDFSVWEIWGALLHGGRLVVVPTSVVRAPAAFRALLEAEGVTVLSQTPSAFRQLVAAELGEVGRGATGRLPLRLVVFGGERLDVNALAPWIERYGDRRPALVNMYGITETTVHVTYRRITAADLDRPAVSPIGLPLPAMTIDLLDDDGRPVPIGTPGEMHVGGSGVARGYLHRDDLTAARFVELDGRRVYRTGDRAVQEEGGGYVYLGRVDDQLKVRGFRIEPGEIESHLAAHRSVSAAVVVPHDFGDGDVRLVAYVVPAPGAPLDGPGHDAVVAELAAGVADTFPEHMRPAAYRALPSVPMTPQGKVDRRALEALPLRQEPASGDRPTDHLTGVVGRVMEISLEVLGRPSLGVDEELFDAGATSLSFVRILALVNQEFGTSLSGAELDEATVRCLASVVEAARKDATGEESDDARDGHAISVRA